MSPDFGMTCSALLALANAHTSFSKRGCLFFCCFSFFLSHLQWFISWNILYLHFRNFDHRFQYSSFWSDKKFSVFRNYTVSFPEIFKNHGSVCWSSLSQLSGIRTLLFSLILLSACEDISNKNTASRTPWQMLVLEGKDPENEGKEVFWLNTYCF